MGYQERVDLIKASNIEFSRIFGRGLGPYVDPLFGFDIVSFDSDIGVPDGISCKDFILEKYGARAVELVIQLIGGE